jgi:hypothetical protein
VFAWPLRTNGLAPLRDVSEHMLRLSPPPLPVRQPATRFAGALSEQLGAAPIEQIIGVLDTQLDGFTIRAF